MAWKQIGGLDGFPYELGSIPIEYAEECKSWGSHILSLSVPVNYSSFDAKTTINSGTSYQSSNPEISYYYRSDGRECAFTIYWNSAKTGYYSFGGWMDSVEWRTFGGFINDETKEMFFYDIYPLHGSLYVNTEPANYNLFKNYVKEAKKKVNPTDYTLYIDGTKNPNYSITWNSTQIGEYVDISRVSLTFLSNYNGLSPRPENFIFLSADYKNGKINFTWDNIWQQLNAEIPIIDGLITNKITLLVHSVTDDIDVALHEDCKIVIHEKKINNEMYSNLVSPSSTGDTLKVELGEAPENKDDSYNNDRGEDDEHSTTIAYDIGNVNLSKCYKVSVARLNNLASKLWDSSFFDNIALLNNSPIENIVGCKLLPIDVSGTDSEIKIGNVLTGTNGEVLTSTVKKFTIGSIEVPRIADYGFLNYAPYTTITIFIPFIGFKELNTSDIMGRRLTVDYIVDIITGACKCVILVNNYQCYEFDGNCGIDIPLSATNRASVEMGYVQSAVGVVTNAMSGNMGGAVSNAVSGALQQYHSSTQGSYSPSTGAFEDRTCFLIIDRPSYTKVSKFGHVKGYKCQLTKTISSLSGYFKTTENVDLSNIDAPKQCKEEILRLLSSGVYV